MIQLAIGIAIILLTIFGIFAGLEYLEHGLNKWEDK